MKPLNQILGIIGFVVALGFLGWSFIAADTKYAVFSLIIAILSSLFFFTKRPFERLLDMFIDSI